MKIGRNEPCPCGSRKKYKHCCLSKEEEASRLASQTQQAMGANLFADYPDQLLFDDWQFVPSEDLIDDDEDDEQEEDDDDWDDDDDEQEENDDDWDGEDGEEDDEDDWDSERDEESNEESKEQLGAVEMNREESEPAWFAEEKKWERFLEQSLDGKIALFEDALAQPDPFDALSALNMLEEIFEDAVKQRARERYDEAAEKFRRRAPEAYRENGFDCRANSACNALVLGNDAALAALVKEMIEIDVSDFEEALPSLAYHNKLDLINEVMPLACIAPEDERHAMMWDPILASFATRDLALALVERNGYVSADDSTWYEPFARFSKIPQAHLVRFMDLLSGKEQRRWRPQDFQLSPLPRKPTVAQNIFDLTLQFQGHLRRAHEMPFSKTELGRDQILNYILKRATGEFKPHLVSGAASTAMSKLRDLLHLDWPEHERLLCPDSLTLGHFIGVLLGLDTSDYYLVASLMKLLPAWLDFLVAQQLLEPAHAYHALLNLFDVYDDVFFTLRKFENDPTLYKDLIGWPWRQMDNARN